MRTTAIFSYKGGSGKTTSTINLGTELAERGYRVVLVDADGQRNLSDFFGVDTVHASTMFELLSGREPYCENLLQPVQTERGSLSIVASSERLAAVELDAMSGAHTVNLCAVRDFVEALAEDGGVDYVLIDCPPSFSPQTVAALAASDDVIIPCTPDCWSVSGLRDVNVSLSGARDTNPCLRIAGVLLTKSAATASSRGTESALRAGELPVFKTAIPASTWAERSSFLKKPLRALAVWSTITAAYAALAEEYIGGVENG